MWLAAAVTSCSISSSWGTSSEKVGRASGSSPQQRCTMSTKASGQSLRAACMAAGSGRCPRPATSCVNVAMLLADRLLVKATGPEPSPGATLSSEPSDAMEEHRRLPGLRPFFAKIVWRAFLRDTISQTVTPKENTSDFVEENPPLSTSTAMYSGVPPARLPAWLARPKSATLAAKLLSTRMFEGLTSLWITGGWHAWRKDMPLATSRMALSRMSMSRGVSVSSRSCMEPRGMSSVMSTSWRVSGFTVAPISIMMLGCRSLAICRISWSKSFS
mmetsp:Transcript_4674/g.13080  ORF Transcript_4674/g.13080 Transcript_4674/m.13080 type:complete len:273 (-) Transcript_4674:2517-3335(-)